MGEVFDVTHNAGNLSEYDATVTDGGDLSAAVGAAMAGSDYGLQAVIDDTTKVYGRMDFSLSSSAFRYRFYFDPNGLSTFTAISAFGNNDSDSKVGLDSENRTSITLGGKYLQLEQFPINPGPGWFNIKYDRYICYFPSPVSQIKTQRSL